MPATAFTARTPLRSLHRIHGAEVKCFTYPATDSPRGAIFAVHGFRGDHHGLALLIEALPEYTVIVPDLPGFGESTSFSCGRHDVPGYARVIEALRRELELPGDTVLLGHSFGSIVAACHLATHPGSFASLVLVNPICEPALEGSQAVFSRIAGLYYGAGAALPARLGDGLLRSRLITDAMSAALTKSRDKEVRAYVVDQHRRYFSRFADRSTLREAYEASISATVREYAPAITVPVRLIVGELDELGSIPAQQDLGALFPDASMAVIDGVGHLIHYEKPGVAAEIVRDFLDSQNG
ncbi:alpha/beta fold hydrolase [Paeniglutamicibacter cryotolerans]|uniref:Pimeloyl-ACP methyl ester carboxylesterase n=1 Tax=Paeniglutamicibacter cryotolerans TaxID=670079 RepID=A0A839QYW9_9MICC|nr:alpha/beta hydrolase [Paeniglutamicibacter cryotolerans]MBB2997161.1 pimeloyl-ACP methyl ester carboxylesterase [Paeniglutamicibacter cryotolerans]